MRPSRAPPLYAHGHDLLTIAAPTFKVGLTAEEKQLYSQLFKSLDTEGTGIVSGEKARVTFEKSGLPPTILGEIWQISDHNNLGFLTQFGFCLAMRLIGQTQAGNHPSLALAERPGPLPKFSGLATSLPLPQPPLQQQPLNSSFMQSHPSSQVPQNSATFNSLPQDPISSISVDDYQKFGQLFVRTVGSPTGELGGARAKDIFLKAKLPTNTLGQIWNLVDKDNLGKLNLNAFVIAMHLIHGVLSGNIRQLPPFLPENVWRSVEALSAGNNGSHVGETAGNPASRQPSYASVSSQLTTVRHPLSPTASREPSISNPWVISPILKQQYEAIFDNLDKQKTGHLNADQVASVLMSSKLSHEDLATVWDLADIQNTGVFTKLEFTIALFLVNKRLSGETLPNIVPDQLIDSIRSSLPQLVQLVQSVAQALAPAQNGATRAPPAPSHTKTAMDDLADIFGSAPRTPSGAPSSLGDKSPTTSNFPEPLRALSKSELTPTGTGDLPKVRKNLTGSFKPTSSFGQNLLHKQPLESPREENEEDRLLGDDHQHQEPTPMKPAAPQKQHTVNYDALRAVPPPPPAKKTQSLPQGQFSPPYQEHAPQPPFSPPHQRGVSSVNLNRDLLADTDPEISGQLSQATSDIANVSNQIKSLAGQTSGLQDKKKLAEQELSKILATKTEIEAKLKQLRLAYDNEVKQVDQVEKNLVTAKEETEALRSEASISEAKFNQLTTELNEKQLLMEDLQKQNSAFKEKLGFSNAEVVELEKQLAQLAAENQRLSNQFNVKKSQLQVLIVKNLDLKNEVTRLEESNRQLSENYRLQAEEERKLTEEHKVLQQRQAAAELNRPALPISVSRGTVPNTKDRSAAENASPSTSSGFGSAAAVAATAVGTAIAGTAAAIQSSFADDTHSKTRTISSDVQGTSKETPLLSQPPNSSNMDISGLVDEVKEHPAADMTGIDDAKELDQKSKELQPEKIEMGLVEDKDYAQGSERSSRQVDSVTESNKSIDDYQENDTPVTSPDNSDFQYQHGSNAGIAGGMVGMPGVLVGVQRTESLTSSVQNNAALSVRDDNIDDLSDRETLAHGEPELTEQPQDLKASHSEFSPMERPPSSRQVLNQDEFPSDGDKLSSGVESFEMVNADDASGGHEVPLYSQVVDVPAVLQTANSVLQRDSQSNEEFPPIKELDYDESSSDDDSPEDKFDDAVDSLPNSQGYHKTSAQSTSQQPLADFDNAFDDLEPAAVDDSRPAGSIQPTGDDFFGNDFEGLQEAAPDNDYDEFAMDKTIDFNDDFTNRETGASDFPDFGEPSAQDSGAAAGDDEWEQLFAGFGSSEQSVLAAIPQEHTSLAMSSPPQGEHVTSLHAPSDVDQLVEELVGMGFDDKTSREALEKENWDLQAATNFLLDHA